MERELLTAFVKEHAHEDPLQLLLQQQRYPHIDLRAVAQQMEGQRQALTKWPTLALCDKFIYPPKLNREQSSSEATARYKAATFRCDSVADLTGGMGIDSFFFAQECGSVDYIEQNPELCNLTRVNFDVLGANNIRCHCEDSIAWVQSDNTFDTIYIDPARRDAHGHKVSAFEDCTPHLLENIEMLLDHCRRLLVKASPMIDLNLALRQLRYVTEVRIVAVGNECKEILFSIQKAPLPTIPDNIPIHCVALDTAGGVRHTDHFTLHDEADAGASYCSQMGNYLYEPHAALMKGGPFSSICNWYGVEKLARNTHLYTSDLLIDNFPGRRFKVMQEISLNKKSVAQILPDRQAHVATRNYPIAAAELQRKLGLKEGGTLFIVAATMGSKPTGWLCNVDF